MPLQGLFVPRLSLQLGWMEREGPGRVVVAEQPVLVQSPLSSCGIGNAGAPLPGLAGMLRWEMLRWEMLLFRAGNLQLTARLTCLGWATAPQGAAALQVSLLEEEFALFVFVLLSLLL